MKTRLMITTLFTGILLLGFLSVSGEKIHPYVLQVIPNDADGDGVVDSQDDCDGEDASYFDRDGDGCIDDHIGMRHIEFWGNEDLPVTYVIHENGAPGITDGSDFTAIQNAIAAWPAVAGTDLTASYGGTTTDGDAVALDHINTVTFDDSDYDFGLYVLAVGVATSFTEATIYDSQTYRPGQIVDADMMFNPAKNFKTATQGYGQDIRSVATHEAGHLFGISHSAVKSSTMFFILPYGTAAQSLETEDETVFIKAYPSAATLASANRLSGSVVDGSSADPLDPDPVPGAIVYAISTGGDTLGCEYTMVDGSYEFFGLPDGNYYVSIYPLNGTSPIAGLIPGYVNPWVDTTAVTVFVPEFYNIGDSTNEDPLAKDAVNVSGGADVTGIDVVTNIDANAPTVLNTSPESSDTGVRIDAAMVIRFSEAVKTSSLQNNFVIREQGPNTAQSGRAVIYRDDSLMSFTQDQPYKFNTTYVCSLKTGITDLFDNPLASPYVVTFTTEQEPLLNITSLVPNKGVPGSVVVINGAGFGWTADQNKVYFHDAAGAVLEAQIGQAGPNRLVVTVPAGAVTGDVYAQSGGETSNDLTFTILSATEIARGFEAGVSTLGGTPRALTVLPDGSLAYVATDDGFSSVGVDPGDAGYLNSIDVTVTGGLNDLDAIPNGKRVYAVSRADSSISVIGSDPQETLLFNDVISTLDVLAEPLGILIEPTGRRAYVPTTGGEIQIWDVQLGSATYWRQVGAFTSPDANVRGKMAFDPLSGDLLALSGTGKLLVFDLGPDTLRAELSVGPDPRDVVVDPAGQRAYVSDGSGVVSIVALGETPYLVQDITTGGSPRGITITPAGLWLYEANRNLDVIDVIDLNQESSTWRSVAATIDQGSDPVDVDLSPEGFYAFSVVEGPKQLVVTTIGLGPVLKSLSRRAGPKGTKLVLAGEGFGWANDNIRINFENEAGGITSLIPEFSTFTAITTTVPSDAVSGPVDVVMWLSDVMNPIPQYSNALYFEVLDTTSTGGFRKAAEILPTFLNNFSPEIAMSPIGDQMALVGNGDEISFVDIDPNSPRLHQILKTTDLTNSLHLTSIKEMGFSPDGKKLYAIDSEYGFVFVLDANRHSSTYGDTLGTVHSNPALPGVYIGLAYYMAMDPAGEKFIVNDTFNSLKIVDIVEGSLTENMIEDTIQVSLVGEMEYHPAGAYVYICDQIVDGIKVLDANPFSATYKRVIYTLPLEADFVPQGTLAMTPRSLSFTPDGAKCLVTSYRTDLAPPARVIFTIDSSNPAAPTVLGRYHDAYFTTEYQEFLDVSPKGDRAIYHSDFRGFQYFDVTPDSTITLVSQYPTFQGVKWDQDFTPDGSRLYCVESLNDTIVIFDFYAAQNIEFVSGRKQVGVVEQPLPAPFRVRVTDSGGAGVKGVAINFQVYSGGGYFADSDSSLIVVLTGSDGYAEAHLTCGPTLGASSQFVEALAPGLNGSPVDFAASTVEDPETLPLVFSELIPPDSTTNVSATTTILATFSRAVDPFTVDDTSFYLHAKDDATHVNLAYGFTDNNRKVSITPTSTLAYNTEYQVEIVSGAGGIEDANGGLLAIGETSIFNTQGPPPLTLASVSPPSAVEGVTLVLAGTGFDPVAANNTVLFNTVEATPLEADADLLKVKVPPGAVTGTIKVRVGAQETNTRPFTVIIPTTSPVDEVIASVGTGAATKSVTMNPDGTIAYTVSPEGDVVIPIDIESEQSLDAINVGDHPIAIVMHPSGNYAYVANFNSNSVSIISTHPDSANYHEVDETVIVGTNPIDIAISPTGDRVVTANAGANSLSFIDGDGSSASHHTVVATAGTNRTTKSVTINPDGTRIYVGTDDGYIVMNADDQGVVATVGTGKATKSLTINPDGSLLVILTTEGDVLIYNIDPNAGANENTVVATVGQGSSTKAVTINPDGTLLYLIQENSNEAIVVSLEIIGSVGALEPGAVTPPFQVIATVIDSVTVGENPEAACFDPSGTGLLVVTNAGDSTVTLLNGSSLPWRIVEADIRVAPRTLQLDSRGRWVTGYIELPAPLEPSDIDISSVLLQDTIPAVPDKWQIADTDSNGVDELVVKFDRAFFQAIMPEGEYVPVTITGVAGTKQFAGDDTIRTIRPTITHPAGGIVNPGMVIPVTWTSPEGYQVDYVDVHWSPDDGESWLAIAEGVPDEGTVAWLTPETQHLMCRVMVTLYRDGEDIGAGMSPETFAIAAPVAVTLADFAGTIEEGSAVLTWRTTMENRVKGFHVLRSHREEDGYERVTADVVPSQGEPEGSAYTYTDDGVQPNQTYYYMLEEVSERGDKQLFGPCKVTYRLKFGLEQNHPNPFNPSTKIGYSIPEDSHVELMVYDVAGRLVRTLVNEQRRANRYVAVWDGKDDRGTPVASGVYFYRIQAGKHRATKKMVVLK